LGGKPRQRPPDLQIDGPLGEELGWRGYALPALATRMTWRTASALIGLIWGLWHLPLFFMAGTPQSHIPIALFLTSILAQSVILAWLFMSTNKSIVPALVMHTSINAWTTIIPVLPTGNTTRPMALMVGAQVLMASVLLARRSPPSAPPARPPPRGRAAPRPPHRPLLAVAVDPPPALWPCSPLCGKMPHRLARSGCGTHGSWRCG